MLKAGARNDGTGAVANAPSQANREIATPPACSSGYCGMSKAGARNDGTGAVAGAPSQGRKKGRLPRPLPVVPVTAVCRKRGLAMTGRERSLALPRKDERRADCRASCLWFRLLRYFESGGCQMAAPLLLFQCDRQVDPMTGEGTRGGIFCFVTIIQPRVVCQQHSWC